MCNQEEGWQQRRAHSNTNNARTHLCDSIRFCSSQLICQPVHDHTIPWAMAMAAGMQASHIYLSSTREWCAHTHISQMCSDRVRDDKCQSGREKKQDPRRSQTQLCRRATCARARVSPTNTEHFAHISQMFTKFQ